MILSGFLSFNTLPCINLVHVQTIHNIYLSPTISRSIDTIELKSVAFSRANVGFDLEQPILQIAQLSTISSIFFLVSSLACLHSYMHNASVPCSCDSISYESSVLPCHYLLPLHPLSSILHPYLPMFTLALAVLTSVLLLIQLG